MGQPETRAGTPDPTMSELPPPSRMWHMLVPLPQAHGTVTLRSVGQTPQPNIYAQPGGNVPGLRPPPPAAGGSMK